MVFDKTGTLTQGKLSVLAAEYPKGCMESTVPLLLGLMSGNKHPVSVAVASYLRSQGVKSSALEEIKTVIGKGVEGIIDGATIRAGNARWFGVESEPDVQALLSRGLTVCCVVINDELHAIFGLQDSLRPDAASVISRLFTRGITVSIVSGDDDGAVRSVAAELGVPASRVRSRCSPSDKRQYVQDLIQAATDNPQNKKKDKHKNVVIFCGDGTNDAVALAQASIGVHVNEGTEIAQSAADVVLVRPALSGILVLIELSRAAVVRIAFNFAWAFTYNLFAILLAAGAFVRVRIPPEYAGLGELVSVLPVVAIALQLKYVKLGPR